MSRNPIRRRTAMLGFAASTGLVACQSAPPKATFAALTYGHKGAVRLLVEDVEVVTAYAAPLRRPNIEHEVPVSPIDTMERWPRDRLLAAGGAERVARYTVVEASLKETELPRTGGLRGALTTDQTERYDLVLAASVEIRQKRGGLVEASAEARVMRFRTVKEGISLAERERVWYELLEQAMNDLDVELERQVRTHLARYVSL